MLILVVHAIKVSHKQNFYQINGICLPEKNLINRVNEEAVLSGFGKTDVNGAVISRYLRKASYLIEPDDYCKQTYGSRDEICGTETEHQICFV